MEAKIKKWEEYTKEEQTNYLTHWFNYYGNMIYNLQELEDFRKLAETRQDDIFDHIVTEFIFDNTIQSGLLLTCMRKNITDELFEKSLNKATAKMIFVGEAFTEYENLRDVITQEITGENQKDQNPNSK